MFKNSDTLFKRTPPSYRQQQQLKRNCIYRATIKLCVGNKENYKNAISFSRSACIWLEMACGVQTIVDRCAHFSRIRQQMCAFYLSIFFNSTYMRKSSIAKYMYSFGWETRAAKYL